MARVSTLGHPRAATRPPRTPQVQSAVSMPHRRAEVAEERALERRGSKEDQRLATIQLTDRGARFAIGPTCR